VHTAIIYTAAGGVIAAILYVISDLRKNTPSATSTDR
jgi:hypothetical protein